MLGLWRMIVQSGKSKTFGFWQNQGHGKDFACYAHYDIEKHTLSPQLHLVIQQELK